MTMCNVRVVAHDDKPTDNYYPTLPFPWALQCIFHHTVLDLWATNVLFWFSLITLISIFYSQQQTSVNSYLSSTKQQTNKVSDLLVSIVENFAAKSKLFPSWAWGNHNSVRGGLKLIKRPMSTQHFVLSEKHWQSDGCTGTKCSYATHWFCLTFDWQIS